MTHDKLSTLRGLAGGRHRIDSWLLVAFLAGTAVLFGLIKLASEVAEGDQFALDKAILIGLRQTHDTAHPRFPDWVTNVMIDVTAMGGVTVLTLVTIFAVLYLVAIGRRRAALFVGVSVSLGAITTTVLKDYFVRPRPTIVPHLVEVSSASFPSGHAMNSALVYLTLAALVARTRQHRGVRLFLMSSALALALLIGISRIYLGVHWPSDVLAGWGIGALWAALSSLVAKVLQDRGEVEPATHAGGSPARRAAH